MKQNVKLSRGEIVWLKYALVSYIEAKQEDIEAIELANRITGTEKLSPEQKAAVNKINDEIKRLWSIHATLETYVTGGFVKGGLPKWDTSAKNT